MDTLNRDDLADELVDEWHDLSTTTSIYQYMRLTHDEYKRWVESPNNLPADFLSRHPERFVKQALELLERLVYEDECDYDHNRSCQAHLFFYLDGEDCPNAQALELLRKLKND